MDRRVEKTRKAIIDSLSLLMGRKDYQSITVGDIIAKANVGRSTFYENFENKDEVFNEILDSLVFHVFDEANHRDGHHFRNDFTGEITHMLIHIRENDGESRNFLLGKSAYVFYTRMGEKVASICDEKLQPNGKIPGKLSHMHIASAFADVLQYWSERNFTDSPETIASYFVYLSNEVFIVR